MATTDSLASNILFMKVLFPDITFDPVAFRDKLNNFTKNMKITVLNHILTTINCIYTLLILTIL